jgi:hypothetical protein
MVNVCSSRMVLNLRDYAAAVAASSGAGIPTSIDPSGIIGSSPASRPSAKVGGGVGGVGNRFRQSWSIWDGSKGDAQLIEMQRRFDLVAAATGQGPALTTPPPRPSSSRRWSNRSSRMAVAGVAYPRLPRPPPAPRLSSLYADEVPEVAEVDPSHADHPYATTTYWTQNFEQAYAC